MLGCKTINRFTFVVLAVLILGLPGLVILSCCSHPPLFKSSTRAAIVDQLYWLQPNEAFIQESTRKLEEYGFQVDVFTGDAVTVDFYRELPAMGYKLILFRVHSGLLGNPKFADLTWLYTNEPYSDTRYTTEQLFDRLAPARINPSAPRFFAISSKFVDGSMEGDFNRAVIIMMGCDGMHNPDLAKVFIAKGASACIGWHRSVKLDYAEDVTLALLDRLCAGDTPIVEALLEVMQEKGPDLDTGAIMKYYPEQSGGKTIAELIR